MKFIIHWTALAVATAAAILIVPGISVAGSGNTLSSVAVLGLALALIDVSVKPIMQILSLPVTVLTLGLFYLVVNTLMLYLAAWLANGLFGTGIVISGFLSAFMASIVISVVASIVGALIGDEG